MASFHDGENGSRGACQYGRIFGSSVNNTTYNVVVSLAVILILLALEIVVGVGVLLMLVARFILRSPFFRIPQESDGEQ